jgi:hypothetical protein
MCGFLTKFQPDARQKFAGVLAYGKNFNDAGDKICRKDVRMGLCEQALK